MENERRKAEKKAAKEDLDDSKETEENIIPVESSKTEEIKIPVLITGRAQYEVSEDE